MLSKRLLTIANYITPGNRLVDVGTDHAYLPIYAVQAGICPCALAADICPGPLEAAKRHIRGQHLDRDETPDNQAEGFVKTRQSDGLHAIRAGEGETLTISGMGGLLIIKILSECPEVTASYDEIILGPQSELPALRAWMSERYTIAADTMICEDGKYYPVIRYIPGGETLSEAEICYGKSRDDTTKAFLGKEIRVREQILEHLTAGDISGKDSAVSDEKREARLERIREVSRELMLINRILQDAQEA